MARPTFEARPKIYLRLTLRPKLRPVQWGQARFYICCRKFQSQTFGLWTLGDYLKKGATCHSRRGTQKNPHDLDNERDRKLQKTNKPKQCTWKTPQSSISFNLKFNAISSIVIKFYRVFCDSIALSDIDTISSKL